MAAKLIAPVGYYMKYSEITIVKIEIYITILDNNIL